MYMYKCTIYMYYIYIMYYKCGAYNRKKGEVDKGNT